MNCNGLVLSIETFTRIEVALKLISDNQVGRPIVIAEIYIRFRSVHLSLSLSLSLFFPLLFFPARPPNSNNIEKMFALRRLNATQQSLWQHRWTVAPLLIQEGETREHYLAPCPTTSFSDIL